MSEDKSPRPGSARAKLEAFERQNKGVNSLMKKLMVLGGLLIMVLAFLFFMSSSQASNNFIDLPKDVAWLIREGKWDKVRDACTDDFKVEGYGLEGADNFVKFLQTYGEKGFSVFASQPHVWVDRKNEAVIEFWGIWARGDLTKKETIPLIKTWRIECRFVLEDDFWKVSRAIVRPTLVDDSNGSVDVNDLLEDK